MKILQNTPKEDIIQNMKDAGCSRDTIKSCMDCMEKGSIEELLKKLDNHRGALLNKIHEGEKQIDCLDYLVYQIGKR